MFDIQSLRQFAILSVRDPRAAAKEMRLYQIPLQQLWLLLVLVSLLPVLILWSLALFSGVAEGMRAHVFFHPFSLALNSVMQSVLFVLGVTYVGRRFRGRGALEEIVQLVTWMNILAMVGVLISLGVLLIFPLLGMLLLLIVAGLAIYMLVGFIQAAHGFASVFGAIILMVGVALGINMMMGGVFSALGINQPTMAG